MYLKLLSVLCLALLQPLRAQLDNRTEIHIAFITSFGGEYDSSGVIPAVQLATELINNRTDLLTDHKIEIELIEDRDTAFNYANSECSRDRSLNSFLSQITTGVSKVALLGCGCSTATEPVAEISGFWNITHMSYASSSDTLSDRQRFPNFWRTYPQESNLASSVVAIMKEYNWTVLKIITEDQSVFLGSTDRLISELEMENITVNQNGTIRFSESENLVNDTDLFVPEVRVYLLNMYSNQAREVLCAASQALDRLNSMKDPPLNFYYPGYVWITLGWYRERWWTEEIANSSLPCSDEDLERFLPRTIGILQANAAANESDPTDVELTAGEFSAVYNEAINSSNYTSELTAYHAYDAVWALAFAFNSSLSELEENGFSLEGFDYSTNARGITTAIHNQLEKTSFVGVSGPVEFNSTTGTRVGIDPKILKYRNISDRNGCDVRGPDSIERVVVATVMSAGNNFTYLECETNETIWPDGIPSDGTPVVVITTILRPIFYAYTVLASLGIIFAIFCLLFNFIFRKRKIVRLISPNLNYLIIIGAIFMYATVYGFVIPTTDPLTVTIACHVRGWLQTTGYFLCFGTIVAKMWRVYYIFHHPQIQKSKRNSRSRGVKDWHLLIIVVLLTSVVVIILFFVAILGDYKATEVEDNETKDERTPDNLVLIEHRNLVCQGPGDTIWIIVSYAYILLTQIVGVVLAFRTRKVKIKALNDAKYIAIIIYLTSVIITIMIICAVLLRDLMNADAATFGGLLLIFATIVLCLVFIPKMVILYRDPKGEKIFERTYSASQPTLTRAGESEVMDRLNELEKHTREIERRLAKHETVTPFRTQSTSFSSSMKLRSGSLNYITPSTPTHAINPTMSLPVTPLKIPPSTIDNKIANGTSGYLTEGDRSSSASAVEGTEKDKTTEKHSDDKPDKQEEA